MRLYQIIDEEGGCVAEADSLDACEEEVADLSSDYPKGHKFYVAEIKTIMSTGISRSAFLVDV